MKVSVGQSVQTPFGKGTVRELRNDGQVLVDVKARALLLRGDDVSRLASATSSLAAGRTDGNWESEATRVSPPLDIDLHGFTVAEALERTEQAINDALLANVACLRLIHGRSSGRIQAALHQRL